ncbi:MAG: 50S ribosomal protein L11 methyltransferase [Defluviitaleaceae bacterium]|nr:50S ribosomal protein L11 methyltransferase [Defluviitaleaceae bacterium]
MIWTKVSVQVTSAGVELVTGLLLSCGINGVEVVDPREYDAFLQQDKKSWDYVEDWLVNAPAVDCAQVVFYLSADAEGEAALVQIKNRLNELSDSGIDAGPLTVSTENVDDATWLDEWKKHFEPIRVGRVAIVPVWDTASPLSPAPEIVFTLDPGSAFGTGQHATTYLCVEALQEKLLPGQMMLDVGCGSGILSVIGLLLGAKSVVACDIDPSAVSAARRNAELNPVDLNRLQILHGDMIGDDAMRAVIAECKYSVIVANIVADVVIALLPFIPALLEKGGYFIASGIIDERAGDVITALDDHALKLISNKKMDGWHCMVCTHG